jgi:hypothetical protein
MPPAMTRRLPASGARRGTKPNGKGIPGFFPPLAGNEHVTTEDPQEVQEHLNRIIFGFHGGLVIRTGPRTSLPARC